MGPRQSRVQPVYFAPPPGQNQIQYTPFVSQVGRNYQGQYAPVAPQAGGNPQAQYAPVAPQPVVLAPMAIAPQVTEESLEAKRMSRRKKFLIGWAVATVFVFLGAVSALVAALTCDSGQESVQHVTVGSGRSFNRIEDSGELTEGIATFADDPAWSVGDTVAVVHPDDDFRTSFHRKTGPSTFVQTQGAKFSDRLGVDDQEDATLTPNGLHNVHFTAAGLPQDRHLLSASLLPEGEARVVLLLAGDGSESGHTEPFELRLEDPGESASNLSRILYYRLYHADASGGNRNVYHGGDGEPEPMTVTNTAGVYTFSVKGRPLRKGDVAGGLHTLDFFVASKK